MSLTRLLLLKRRSLTDRGGRGCWGALGRPRGLGRALWKRAPAVDWDVLGPVPGSVILGKSTLRSLSLSFLARNTGPSPARPGPPGSEGARAGLAGWAQPGRGTHLRRTSGTGRGSATRCPGPRRTRYPGEHELRQGGPQRPRFLHGSGLGARRGRCAAARSAAPGSARGWPHASASRPRNC